MFEEHYANAVDTSGSVRSWLQAGGVALATALLVAAPFFRLGSMVGHDFAFHMTSWMDVALLALLGEEETAWNLGQAVEEPVHNPGDSAAA